MSQTSRTSAASAKDVSFDVYVRRDGRWSLHTRFDHKGREVALAIAADLDEDPQYEGVRVMTLRHGVGKGDVEIMLWLSPRLAGKTPAPPRRKAAGPASAALAADEPHAQRIEAEDDPPASTSAGRKTTKAAGFSSPHARHAAIAGGALGTGTVAALGAAQIAEALGLSAVAAKVAPAAAFLLAAAATAGALFAALKPAPHPPGKPRDNDTPEMRRPAPKAPPAPSKEIVEGRIAAAEPAAVEETAPILTEADGTPVAVNEDYRLILLQFLEGVIAAIKDAVPRLDNFNAFGLNLFLTGAAECLGDQLQLPPMQKFVLVREAISAIGTKPELIDGFGEKLPEYRSDSKYRAMIECGRGAMESYLAGRDEPFGGLSGAFTVWNRPTAVAAHVQGIVVIMFTDMVGSTQMTQERGDYGAQQAVRTHNAIVRGALAAHSGHEVKHTGDGIMASFVSAPSAVNAAIEIQREIARHNEASGAPPVEVRIGLNAGTTIQEEDDFFGATVQLAARVCAQAGSATIYVAEAVKELCAGHDLRFEDRGSPALKGIDKPVALYEAAWREENAAG